MYLFNTNGFYKQAIKKGNEAAGLYDDIVVTFYTLWCLWWHLQRILVAREILTLKKLLAMSLQR